MRPPILLSRPDGNDGTGELVSHLVAWARQAGLDADRVVLGTAGDGAMPHSGGMLDAGGMLGAGRMLCAGRVTP